MKKTRLTLISTLVAICQISSAAAQGVGIGTSSFSTDPSSILDIRSTERGVLVSRMNTQQMLAIVTPATGLLIYNTDEPQGFYSFNGQHWLPVSDGMGNHSASQNVRMNSQWISNDGDSEGIYIAQDGKVGIGAQQSEATLTVGGSIAVKTMTVNVNSAMLNDLPIGNAGYIRLVGATSDFVLTGLSQGADGQMLTILNYSSFQMKIPNDNAGSAPLNRILTTSGAYTSNDVGVVNLIYDAFIGRWIITSARK